MIRTCLLAMFASALMAQTPATPAAIPKAATPKAAAAPAPVREPGLYATFNTSMGPIVCVLYEKESPIAVTNFVALSRGTKAWTDPQTGQQVKRPLYSGTIFHRVIPGFMIQGGDPLGNGTGGPGGQPFRDEFSPTLTFDKPGRLAMANSGPNTNGSQFFISEVPTPHLNGKHTIFGQVIEGQELVTKIANVPKGPNDKPTTPVKLLNVRIVRYPLATSAAPAAKKAAAPTAAKKTAAPAAGAPAAAKKTAAPAAAKKTAPPATK